MREVYYIFGSKSSVDVDIAVVLPPDERTNQQCKELCEQYQSELQDLYEDKKVNVNLITILYGKVVWCYKGTIDELNNSLIDTYSLHKQPYRLVIKKRVERDFELKALRVVRVMLSFLSRTEHRPKVKEALRSDIHHQLKVLESIDLGAIDDLGNKKVSMEDYCKTMAFQMGQLFGLLRNKELYTKESIAEEFPAFSGLLARETDTKVILEYYKTLMISILKKRDWEKTRENE